MKILNERSHNGVAIHGDAVMLSKYGEVYNAIDNLYHPNPGSKEDGYPEIERCIDWCYDNYLKPIFKDLDEWIKIRVAQEMDYSECANSIDGLIDEIMYADLYEPCKLTKDTIINAYNYFKENPKEQEKYAEKSELDPADKVVNYINEKFTRVRAGGKLNPDGTNSIYFRISSHGYDWHRTIVDFLWGIFGEPNKMPKKIWIGHDAENNPPEVTLFDGTPNELLEYEDTKIFEGLERNITFNRDRDVDRRNRLYYDKVKYLKKYIPFK